MDDIDEYDQIIYGMKQKKLIDFDTMSKYLIEIGDLETDEEKEKFIEKLKKKHSKTKPKKTIETKRITYKPKNLMKGRADLVVPKKGRPRVEANIQVSKSIDAKTKRALKKAILEEVNKKIVGTGIYGTGLRKEINKLLKDEPLLELIVSKIKKDGKSLTNTEVDFKEGLSESTINKIIEAGINALEQSKPVKKVVIKEPVKNVVIKEPVKEIKKEVKEQKPKLTFMSFVKQYKEDNNLTTTIKELAKQDNVKEAWKNKDTKITKSTSKKENKDKQKLVLSKLQKLNDKAEQIGAIRDDLNNSIETYLKSNEYAKASKVLNEFEKYLNSVEKADKKKKEVSKPKPVKQPKTKDKVPEKVEIDDDYLSLLKADILGAKSAEKPKALTDFTMPKLTGDKWSKRDTLLDAYEERRQAYIESRGNKTIKAQMEKIEKEIIKIMKD